MKTVSYLICILCIIICYNANGQSNYKYHKVLDSVKSNKINSTSGYVVEFSSTNYVNVNDTLHQLNLIETYTYIEKSIPKLQISLSSAYIINKGITGKNGVIEESINPDFRNVNTLIQQSSVNISKYFTTPNNTLTMNLGDETYSKRDIRNQFIEDKNLYGKCFVRNLFVFVNYSPSYGYKTLKSPEINNAETYDEFRKIDTLNFVKEALPSFNTGIGFSFYNGHSIALSWQHLPISKFDNIFLIDKNAITRNLYFISYRYQKPHFGGLVKPVLESSIGGTILNNKKLNGSPPQVWSFYLKNSLGASIMLSKNVYINLGPYYLRRLDKYIVGNGNGSNNKLNIKAIDHFWGIDVGIVYKFWGI